MRAAYKLRFHYHFHPVGQGLFASGCLFEPKVNQPRFLWVYDCGSVSFNDEPTWGARVGELKKFTQHKAAIELMTLSHFDKDHISGVTALLSQFKVDTLLLPYAPLSDRLEEAFATGVGISSEEMRYIINPVAFLREIATREKSTIRRVILVLPNGGEGPPVEADPPPGDDGRNESPEGSWPLEARTKRVTPDDGYARDFGMSEEVELLPPDSCLTTSDLWEFVPYNRAREDIRPAFAAEVQRLRETLLHGSKEEREQALDSLKAFYQDQIARSSRARNDISLFLYAGPVYENWKSCMFLYHHQGPLGGLPKWLARRHHKHCPALRSTTRCSVLYSGDGYLNTLNASDALSTRLGEERLGLLGVFQVNHHGARGNWHQGLADKLKPSITVFSSDPARPNTFHPHAEVLRDFWPYHPVQVNEIGHSSGGCLFLSQKAREELERKERERILMKRISADGNEACIHGIE